MRKTILACAVVALVVGSTSATAATLITGKDIKDGTITAQDIKRGSISSSRLARGLREQLQQVGAQGGQGATGAKGDPGAQGPKGDTGAPGRDGFGQQGPKGDKGDKGLTHLESDGPYPGATDLGSIPGEGDNSDALWKNDGTRQTSWVMCPPGKKALGGGFHVAADAGDAAAKAIQVAVSEPTQVKNGKTVYDDPAVYEPIPGDAAMSIRPNGWIVQGFNTGASDVVVRPWVVCAEVD